MAPERLENSAQKTLKSLNRLEENILPMRSRVSNPEMAKELDAITEGIHARKALLISRLAQQQQQEHSPKEHAKVT